ncbi:unnamed protein product [Closterium sp. NIES-65]|nr:unnamed protein product [Closterium sp. NIES-65]
MDLATSPTRPPLPRPLPRPLVAAFLAAFRGFWAIARSSACSRKVLCLLVLYLCLSHIAAADAIASSSLFSSLFFSSRSAVWCSSSAPPCACRSWFDDGQAPTLLPGGPPGWPSYCSQPLKGPRRAGASPAPSRRGPGRARGGRISLPSSRVRLSLPSRADASTSPGPGWLIPSSSLPRHPPTVQREIIGPLLRTRGHHLPGAGPSSLPSASLPSSQQLSSVPAESSPLASPPPPAPSMSPLSDFVLDVLHWERRMIGVGEYLSYVATELEQLHAGLEAQNSMLRDP